VADLFDSLTPEYPPVEARAATADPSTSHEAADRMNRSGTARRNAAAVLVLVKAHPWLTSRELSELPDCPPTIDRVEMARRLPDLERAGKVKQGPKRTCKAAGSKAVTWYPVG
jgi:hypothetical protein